HSSALADTHLGRESSTRLHLRPATHSLASAMCPTPGAYPPRAPASSSRCAAQRPSSCASPHTRSPSPFSPSPVPAGGSSPRRRATARSPAAAERALHASVMRSTARISPESLIPIEGVPGSGRGHACLPQDPPHGGVPLLYCRLQQLTVRRCSDELEMRAAPGLEVTDMTLGRLCRRMPARLTGAVVLASVARADQLAAPAAGATLAAP